MTTTQVKRFTLEEYHQHLFKKSEILLLTNKL
jgi:hypothetical protein